MLYTWNFLFENKRKLPAMIKDLNNSETEKYHFFRKKKKKSGFEIENSLLP